MDNHHQKGISMNRLIIFPCLVLSVISFSFAKKAKVSLGLDYAAQKNWVYAIDYQSECIFDQDSETLSKKTSIQCDIAGIVSDKKDNLVFKAKNISIKSGLFTDSSKTNIHNKLSKAKYSLALVNGHPFIDTTTNFSKEGLPEWDLYMKFAKLLPEMPQQSVKKGFTWERTATLPVKSVHGMVSCEVFRQYTIDRFSPRKDTAYVSWLFRYAVDKNVISDSDMLKHMPVAGKGKGSAVIDITNKFIISADMKFETPVAEVGTIKVKWNETASLKYKK